MKFRVDQFIDVHCHILPAVDDGPPSVETSLSLARRYSDFGVRSIIATPHYIPGTAWMRSADEILTDVGDLNNLLQTLDLPLTVYPGMEVAYHKKLLQKIEKNELLPLGHSDKYLIEPSFQGEQRELVDVLKKLVNGGEQVIIAHPERIPFFQKRDGLLMDLSAQGVEIQLNIGSILGKFGAVCQKTADRLLDAGHVQYLASDAHGAERRSPPTPLEWKKLEERIGLQLLTQYCVTNPAKLIVK